MSRRKTKSYETPKDYNELSLNNQRKLKKVIKGRKLKKGGSKNSTTPADKSKETRGIKLKGGITLKQYLYLVQKFGVDGDECKNWTKHKASKEISKFLKKN